MDNIAIMPVIFLRICVHAHKWAKCVNICEFGNVWILRQTKCDRNSCCRSLIGNFLISVALVYAGMWSPNQPSFLITRDAGNLSPIRKKEIHVIAEDSCFRFDALLTESDYRYYPVKWNKQTNNKHKCVLFLCKRRVFWHIKHFLYKMETFSDTLHRTGIMMLYRKTWGLG